MFLGLEPLEFLINIKKKQAKLEKTKIIIFSSKFDKFSEFWKSDIGWTPIEMVLMGVHPKNIYATVQHYKAEQLFALR
jgi:hypothetical protein